MDTKKVLKLTGDILFYFIIILVLVLTLSISKAKKTGQQPDIFGYKLYTVLTGSMQPTINPGSLIIVKESNPQEIKPNDIITFASSNTNNITTHRVKNILNDKDIKFETQGDANNAMDPVPIDGDLLVGKVVLHVPYLGATLNFIQTNTWILWAGVGMMIIISFIPNKNKTTVSESQ